MHKIFVPVFFVLYISSVYSTETNAVDKFTDICGTSCNSTEIIQNDDSNLVYLMDFIADCFKAFINPLSLTTDEIKECTDTTKENTDFIIDLLSSGDLTPDPDANCNSTEIIQNGTDIRTVQELLGHTDLKTTEIYTHVVGSRFSHTMSPVDRI